MVTDLRGGGEQEIKVCIFQIFKDEWETLCGPTLPLCYVDKLLVHVGFLCTVHLMRLTAMGLGLSEPNAFHAFIFLWSEKRQGNCCWINVPAVPLHANSSLLLLPARSGNKHDQFGKRMAHPPSLSAWPNKAGLLKIGLTLFFSSNVCGNLSTWFFKK